jgi:hypothetical protein
MVGDDRAQGARHAPHERIPWPRPLRSGTVCLNREDWHTGAGVGGLSRSCQRVEGARVPVTVLQRGWHRGQMIYHRDNTHPEEGSLPCQPVSQGHTPGD